MSRSMRPSSARVPRFARRGMLLVVVLTIIAVMSVVAASFAYMMNADLASVEAMQARQQARLAAESGIARAMLLLREHRTDLDQWYDNEDVFRRVLVWSPGRIGGSESAADKDVVEGRPAWRYSVVGYEKQQDETRIRFGLTGESSKLNLRTASRGQLIRFFDQFQFENVSAMELADALLDWQSSEEGSASPYGAGSSYYMTLEPQYRAKNRPLQTVEELLMVKGFTGQVVYGEDYNRNGYLDENEDDGPDGVFPLDDGDGVLDQGIRPFVTVYSSDFNSANDNRPRININLVDFSRTELLPDYLVEEISPEVIEFIAEAQKRKYTFRSVGELLELEVYENGTSNYDDAWEQFEREVRQADRQGLEAAETQSAPSPEGERGEENTPDPSQRPDRRNRSNRERRNENEGGDPNEEGGAKGGTKTGTPIVSPVSADQMDVLLDRLTTVGEPVLRGRIDVNTAPLEVLASIPGLTEEQAQAIVNRRSQVTAEEKETPAWLVSFGVLEPQTFALVSNALTSRSLQFYIDVIGFADHVDAACRLEAIVEMTGHLAQLKYYRDITALGLGYPRVEENRSEGYASYDR